MHKGIGLTVAVALTAVVGTGSANAADKIKIGVTATLEGTYTVLGEDGIRGFKVAVNKYGPKAGGKELEFVIASTDATPDSAVRAVRKLIAADLVKSEKAKELAKQKAQETLAQLRAGKDLKDLFPLKKTEPGQFDFSSFTSYPAKAADAGFVPCAESGMRMYLRALPLFASAL